MEPKPYVDVRALSRGIALLLALNRQGEARASALAKAAGIDRTTTYRLLATLERLGLVSQRTSDDAFVLAPAVRNLSDGYSDRDHLTRSAARHLGQLFQEILWPTDFATFDGRTMVIRETTHRFSPYSVHRGMIGRSRPLFGSALGRAFLAGANPEQRLAAIEMAQRIDRAALGTIDPLHLDATIDRLLDDHARCGYAWSIGGTEEHISAIALPIVRDGTALGAINVVFFRSAMKPPEAAERFLNPLKACIDRIISDLSTDTVRQDH